MPSRRRLSSISRHDRLARQARAVRARPHPAVHLGGEHDLVARRRSPFSARPMISSLRAVGVDVGGVEEVDPGVEGRRMNGRLGLVEAAPTASGRSARRSSCSPGRSARRPGRSSRASCTPWDLPTPQAGAPHPSSGPWPGCQKSPVADTQCPQRDFSDVEPSCLLRVVRRLQAVHRGVDALLPRLELQRQVERVVPATGAGCRRGTTGPPAGWASTCCAARPPTGPGPWWCPSRGPSTLPTLSAISCADEVRRPSRSSSRSRWRRRRGRPELGAVVEDARRVSVNCVDLAACRA